MDARKTIMEQWADAYAILPGGLGTLDEAFQVLTNRALGLENKPVVFVNWGGYYAPLLTAIWGMRQAGMIPKAELYHVSDSSTLAIEYLKQCL